MCIRDSTWVEVPAREVEIYQLKLLSFSSGKHPQAEFELCCSKGTYVRSLCQDIGKRSGYGAYQASLRRTKVGVFSLSQARDLEEIERAIKTGNIKHILFTPADSLPHFRKVTVKKGVEVLMKWGRPLYSSHISEVPRELEKGDRVRFCSEKGDLVGVGIALQSGSHFVRDKVGFKYLRVLV